MPSASGSGFSPAYWGSAGRYCLRPTSAAEPLDIDDDGVDQLFGEARPPRQGNRLPSRSDADRRVHRVPHCHRVAPDGRPSRGSGGCDVHHDALGGGRGRWRSEQRGSESAVRRHNASTTMRVARSPRHGPDTQRSLTPRPCGAWVLAGRCDEASRSGRSPAPVVRRHRARVACVVLHAIDIGERREHCDGHGGRARSWVLNSRGRG
jgi:hypothetical protein